MKLLGMSMPNRQEELKRRVARAAEAALARQQYVSAIDVLCGMGLLTSTHVDSWCKGQIDCLKRIIEGNPGKIFSSLSFFEDWSAPERPPSQRNRIGIN